MVISNSVKGFAKRCCFTLAVMPTVSILIITDIVNQAFVIVKNHPASKFGSADSSSFAFVVEASTEVVITIELVSKQQPSDLARNKVITKE